MPATTAVLVDTTLRDGAQMPGAVLLPEHKKDIAAALLRCGIRHIEAGFPASGPEECADIRMIRRLFPQLHLSVWARARRDDIDAAAATGADAVHISFPVSTGHRLVLGWSGRRVLEELAGLAAYARQRFGTVTVGAQDAFRAPRPFLGTFVRRARAAGTGGVRIADTVGTATPESVRSLFGWLCRSVPGFALEFHGHDDFGLATANTLAALRSGAAAASCTVCGVGERSGNAAFEQVCSAAQLLYGMDTGIDLAALPGLCQITAAAFGLPAMPNRPVYGTNAFRHESGIHCHGMLRDPVSYQPVAASVFGRKEEYTLGPHAGRSTLRAWSRAGGKALSGPQSEALLALMKSGRSARPDVPGRHRPSG